MHCSILTSQSLIHKERYENEHALPALFSLALAYLDVHWHSRKKMYATVPMTVRKQLV